MGHRGRDAIAAQKGARVLVTVDCGAASHDALGGGARCGSIRSCSITTRWKKIPGVRACESNGPDDCSGITYDMRGGSDILFLVAVQRMLREQGWFASLGVDETI
jgi:single-stranded-DNA-specific exonuclease